MKKMEDHLTRAMTDKHNDRVSSSINGCVNEQM